MAYDYSSMQLYVSQIIKDRDLKGWETLNWKRPYPIEKAQPNKVELVMPLESLLDKGVLSELNRLFGKRMNYLNSHERMTISMALTEEVINNERLRDTLALHPADITHMLQRLCKEGFLTASGHGRGTVYSLKVTTSTGAKVTTSTGAKVTTSTGAKVTTSSGTKVILPSGSRVRIPTESQPSSFLETKVTTSEDMKVTTSKGTKVTTSARMSKEEMRKRIMDYCSDWRTVSEIAEHLERTKQYIRIKVLPDMSDVLQMKFEKENHPGQKYKVKE